jgi:hypothetical protein
MNFFSDTHLKPTTYKTYNTHVLRWLSLFPLDQHTLSFIYTHPNYSIVILRKHLDKTQQNNARTVNSFIKALMAAVDANRAMVSHLDDTVLKQSDARWKELRQITYNHAYAYRLEQEPSPLQKQMSGATLTLNDLIHIRDALPDGSIHKLLIGFYTHIPPVRADYYATEIIPFGSTPTQPNYIFHSAEKSRLVITDFKTNKFYHDITQDLPEDLHRQLVLSLASSPRTYLFINKNGEPFTRNGFTKWATEQLFHISKKGLTITMLRHIYISSLDFNSTPSTLLEIGKKMGHQLSQQMLYKWRNNENIVNNE